MITLLQLSQLYTRAPAPRLNLYFPPLIAAMSEAEIDTPLREAAFLAQIGLESAELKYMSEIWGPTPQQLRYDPPSTLAARLGNTQAGDGFRFRGAGPIQITGRSNYRAAGQALGLDLENNPDLARTPAVGFRLAGWYWTSHQLNPLADASNFDAITQAINGGFNGKAQRDAYYQKALQLLGA